MKQLIADPNSQVSGNGRPVILLIEDNEQLRELLADILSEDYVVLQAGDGEEGIEKALTKFPDMVITDLMMPRLDGYHVVRRLKSHPKTAAIPVVLLTALSDENNLIQGWDSGADHYFIKPIKAREFTARIKNILVSRRNLEHALVEKNHFQISNGNPFKEPVLEILDTYILENIENIDLKIEEMADKLNLSHGQLERKMKKLTGLTPVAYLRRQRVYYASELLKNPTQSVAEVGFKSGFSDAGYFGRCFKEEFKITPKKFQDEWLRIKHNRD
jgi:DNA-binding response OmpR family regulator